MGYDYALVHLKYNLPPAVALTLLYRPLCTKLDIYKVVFLIAIAVCSTIPWDSYLIRTRIWTYPENVIVGPTLFSIPAEEVFFFVVQTYNTSLLYLLLSKPTFHPVYLRGQKALRECKRLGAWRSLGVCLIGFYLVTGIWLVHTGGRGLYMGLILVWACPFLLLLWSLAYQFLLGLPKSNTLVPVIIPTLYLWIVDTLALRRGTWTIESGTKLDWQLWEGLEVEEAIFFLLTNMLIVFGLVAFDNAYAVLQTFEDITKDIPALPSPLSLIGALLAPTATYNEDRIDGLSQALARLKAKSRSFYLASGVFQGRLRIDLILLYSFCRVADDLVDDAASFEEAEGWIAKLRAYLRLRYKDGDTGRATWEHIIDNFPASAHLTLRLLPTDRLSPGPLYELLEGFETDLQFSAAKRAFPIRDESALTTYGSQVAGTVAESCLELVYHHYQQSDTTPKVQPILKAGHRMGIALQYVNIARDIAVDAANSRVYIPTSWLKEETMAPEDVIQSPLSPKVERLRQKLLDRAMLIYAEARHAIEVLPTEARAPMRVAVESYVEIGRVLRTTGYQTKAGRATVPKARRLRVAWKALQQS